MRQYQVHKVLLFLSTQISFAININGANDLRMIKPDFQDVTVSTTSDSEESEESVQRQHRV